MKPFDFHTVVITFEYPPIPFRKTDYRASIKGEEEGFSGWGETPAEALRDLAEQIMCFEEEAA